MCLLEFNWLVISLSLHFALSWRWHLILSGNFDALPELSFSCRLVRATFEESDTLICPFIVKESVSRV
ncbi:hypothetical protein Pyn_13304 [Prunus yedoensis var. nudiflora]|uniref:Uncharacterized protein n=1 Tax=Prunus yedoensis var. nudiflora TaxID=2094558 RepID=A0A314UUM7_PRUYE|nr:hypothetical protein Pyn_13304 [Prunus yedoensis var. nudiflora]